MVITLPHAPCPIAERIARLTHDIVVRADGEPTALYYHVTECDACESLRHQTIEEAKHG